jgi:oligoribonuclease NrnB/cAMP/cGMP phosphodiesterase (DHH superfamily)
MICIYHSKDLDGMCSGAIVKRKYPDAKLIGYDYWQELPWDQIPEGEEVIMVDVSVPIPVMDSLAIYCSKLTWIDHHASSIKEYEQSIAEYPHWPNDHNFTAVLQDGIAACEITWKYLFPNEPKPMAVQLLGMYDTWRQDGLGKFKWEEDILPFQYAMRVRTNSADTFPMELLESRMYSTIDKYKDRGETILEYQRQQDTKAMSGAFEVEFKGLRAIACNIKGVNSLAFDSVYNPDQHDIMVAFGYGHGKWGFSLRTTHEHIDCSVIAKQFGGGGHKKAAGFGIVNLQDAIILP